MNKFITAFATLLLALSFIAPSVADAAPAKKNKPYKEEAFLHLFGGKSRKQVSEILGAPVRKEQSVKPANAETMTAGSGKLDQTKPVNVEMWYYNDIVTYDGKRTYKTTEITFVNDRVQNIGFINDR